MALPESIDPFLFASHDGRITTEAETALCAAQQVLANGRHIQYRPTLERAIVIAGMYAHSQKWPAHLTFPVLGMIAGGNDRNVFRLPGVRGWALSRWMRLVSWHIERCLTRQCGPRARGWNDYFMALWFLTGADAYLEELHARATQPASEPEGKGVELSAVWMLNSVRTQYADFDAALSELETRSGRLVPAPTQNASAYSSIIA